MDTKKDFILFQSGNVFFGLKIILSPSKMDKEICKICCHFCEDVGKRRFYIRWTENPD